MPSSAVATKANRAALGKGKSAKVEINGEQDQLPPAPLPPRRQVPTRLAKTAVLETESDVQEIYKNATEPGRSSRRENSSTFYGPPETWITEDYLIEVDPDEKVLRRCTILEPVLPGSRRRAWQSTPETTPPHEQINVPTFTLIAQQSPSKRLRRSGASDGRNDETDDEEAYLTRHRRQEILEKKRKNRDRERLLHELYQKQQDDEQRKRRLLNALFVRSRGAHVAASHNTVLQRQQSAPTHTTPPPSTPPIVAAASSKNGRRGDAAAKPASTASHATPTFTPAEPAPPTLTESQLIEHENRVTRRAARQIALGVPPAPLPTNDAPAPPPRQLKRNATAPAALSSASKKPRAETRAPPPPSSRPHSKRASAPKKQTTSTVNANDTNVEASDEADAAAREANVEVSSPASSVDEDEFHDASESLSWGGADDGTEF